MADRGIKYALNHERREDTWYLYQKQRSMDQRGKVGTVSCNPTGSRPLASI